MAKESRFRRSYRNSASSLHVAVGDMLKGSAFKNYKIYQEYPVSRVSPYFKSGRERYDWVILDMKLAIEVHGQQHYRPVTFGGVTKEEAKQKFEEQRVRDAAKKHAAEQVGWKYIVFRYDEDPAEGLLWDKVLNYQASCQIIREPAIIEQLDPRREARLAAARNARKRQYQRAKAWRRENRESGKR